VDKLDYNSAWTTWNRAVETLSETEGGPAAQAQVRYKAA